MPEIIPLPLAVTIAARVAAVLALATGIFGTVPQGARQVEGWVHDTLERRRLSQLGITGPLHAAEFASVETSRT